MQSPTKETSPRKYRVSPAEDALEGEPCATTLPLHCRVNTVCCTVMYRTALKKHEGSLSLAKRNIRAFRSSPTSLDFEHDINVLS